MSKQAGFWARLFGRKEIVTTSSVVGWSNIASYSETNFEALAQHGWRKNELIFACISKTANTSAQIALDVQVNDQSDPDINHPLKQLIQAPNPYMNESDFWSAVIIFQKLAGRAIFEKVRSRAGKVVQLWPLRPDWVKVVSNGNLIAAYQYEPPGVTAATLDPQDVVDFRLFDPLNKFHGWPPAAVASRSGDVDNSATDLIKLIFDAGGVPPGILKSTQRLMPDQVDQIRAAWKARYGGYRNWSEPAVLDSDASYQRTGFTFSELGFEMLDARNEARICAVLDVPPILVGAKIGLDRATYSNYGEARRAWWEDSLLPMYAGFEDVLINQLGVEFGKPMISWNTQNIPALQEERNGRWARATTALQAGAITVNEFCFEVGLPNKGLPGEVYLRGMATVEVPAKTGVRPASEAEVSGKSLKRAADDSLRREHERIIEHEMADYFKSQLKRIAGEMGDNGR